MQMQIAFVLLAYLYLPSTEAEALSPAIPEQFVCSASLILVGHVLSAKNDDVIHLTIRVDKLLGTAHHYPQLTAEPIVQEGDILNADSSASATFDLKQGPHFPGLRMLTDGPRRIVDDDKEIISLFIGEELLVGVDMGAKPNPWANVWYLNETNWVKRAFAGCQR
ncbi:MAG TPA: hypothetical protein VN900_04835 [Stellaceae bacterium]|jgi:hypothetical protein|nr:hypothetical protein [Stellaceae bacterium]